MASLTPTKHIPIIGENYSSEKNRHHAWVFCRSPWMICRATMRRTPLQIRQDLSIFECSWLPMPFQCISKKTSDQESIWWHSLIIGIVWDIVSHHVSQTLSPTNYVIGKLAPCRCQDRKPLTTDLASEDAQLEARAAHMCSELAQDDMGADMLKARYAVLSTCSIFKSMPTPKLYRFISFHVRTSSDSK